MEVQKNKIKIWDRISPNVLIPLMVLGSLGAAAFLIWLGIKLAPVELLDPEKLSADKQQEEWRKKRAGKENGNDNGSENGSSTEYEYIPTQRNEGADEGMSSETENANSSVGNGGEIGSEVNSNSSEVDNAGELDDASSSNTNNGGGTKSTGSSSAAGNATYTGCTYPTGDINVWWHSASLKQRDCYISKHGVPVFSQEEPYFCDYEKSQDCYYMEYK